MHASVHLSGVKVRVAPGEALVPWPVHIPLPEKCGVFEWVESSPGTYRAKLRLHGRMTGKNLRRYVAAIA